MPRLTDEQLPNVRKVVRQGWHLLLPIILLVVFLACYSPVAVFWSIVALVAASWIGDKEHRMTPQRIIDAMISGGTGAVDVAAACACSGIVIGVIAITGLGLAFSSFVLSMSQGILPLALFLTMIGSIILGMGVPTTAQYIITSTLAAPARPRWGPHVLGTPFLSLLGVLADVTPPVALATYASANSEIESLKTGFTALLVAAAGHSARMFIYNPPSAAGERFRDRFAAVTALIAVIGLGSGAGIFCR